MDSENVSNDPPESDGSTAETSSAAKSGGPLSGALGVCVFVVLFGAAGYLVYRTVTVTMKTAEDPVPNTPPVMYMCAETGKTFKHVPQMGEKMPIQSPHSGKKTGYRAEQCFCVKDGKQATEPTYVILNDYLGKKGPTTCPSCGALVYPHNTEFNPPGKKTP
ncbi:MAG: hypothetical protein ACE5EQ_05490 [Phycisphaerae bacterium]